MKRVLGVDLGTERTGVAIGVGGIAQPSRVLTMKGDELVRAIAGLARDEGATEVVLGHPVSLDGTEGPAATRVREIAESLRAATDVPVVLWDERLTTAEAERALVGAGVRRKRRRGVIDKVAAAVMLQSYLDAGGGSGALKERTDSPPVDRDNR